MNCVCNSSHFQRNKELAVLEFYKSAFHWRSELLKEAEQY